MKTQQPQSVESLIATAPCGFVSFADGGRILALNQGLREMLGLSPDAETPAHLDAILSPAARIFCQTHVFPMLALKGSVEEIYLALRGANGVDVPVLINAVRLMRDGMSVIDAVLVRMRQRMLFEAELISARREAERASKAKDDFLAALSHELRTPLSPVLMTAVALESEPGLSDEVREQVAIIRRNAELEARLIDDLLDITRIANGKLHLALEDTDIHVLAARTLELIGGDAAEKRIDLSFELEATSSFVRGDPTRLQQVFWNLVKNAVKFTPVGGRVVVATRNESPGRLMISVADTGEGIDPAALSRIFDAFEQGSASTQQRFGGLGLGLAISRAIVALHEGIIRADSLGKGSGATFTVELATATTQAPVSRAAPGEISVDRKLRLLLVEDHLSSLQVLTRLLTRAGHEVHPAESAEEALRIAQETPLDLVISDLGLPGQSGLELMRELKSRYGLAGIALTGYGMESDIAGTRSAGFAAHLVKPVSFEQLKILLHEATAKS